MKRILSMIIALALVLSLATTAFATEGSEQPLEPPQEETQQEETPVVVSTLEDLQAAVTAAEDGDTIAVSAEIMLDGVALETDKDITLVRADSYESGSFFRLKNGALISGFTIENYKSSTTVVSFTLRSGENRNGKRNTGTHKQMNWANTFFCV